MGVAAAVTSAIMHPPAAGRAETVRPAVTRPPNAGTAAHHVESGDPAELLASLRAARKAQRLRTKKNRRRSAKAARESSVSAHADTASQFTGSRGDAVPVPAQASDAPAAPAPSIVLAGAPELNDDSVPPGLAAVPASQAVAQSKFSCHTLRGAALSVAPSLVQDEPMDCHNDLSNLIGKRDTPDGARPLRTTSTFMTLVDLAILPTCFAAPSLHVALPSVSAETLISIFSTLERRWWLLSFRVCCVHPSDQFRDDIGCSSLRCGARKHSAGASSSELVAAPCGYG